MNAILLLSSINLPGGVQRKRTYMDELNMRSFYKENDLISAEVHSFFQDGSMSLHTRSQRYGKLLNGIFTRVPSALVKRCKSHIHAFDFGVTVVFGNNGYVWIYPTADPIGTVLADAPTDDPQLLVALGSASQAPAAGISVATSESTTVVTSAGGVTRVVSSAKTATAVVPVAVPASQATKLAAWERLVRVRNSVAVLAEQNMAVFPASVLAVFNASVAQCVSLKDMLNPKFSQALTAATRERPTATPL
eukprot:TRINITY_DN5413_c0_g1_i2.p1 TRINITY_DN5413_c0_g1~~TRINITY_DN5413_c0_g1_i2.p1  ORF type:complete len:249 (-),score=65.28 TRINITY_DN5413_c0_g1_i2:73-819(-)